MEGYAGAVPLDDSQIEAASDLFRLGCSEGDAGPVIGGYATLNLNPKPCTLD